MTGIKVIMTAVAAMVLGLCPVSARADYYTSALTSRGGAITSAEVSRIGQRMGGTSANHLQRFYGAYYSKLSDGHQDAIDRQAFQLAVWELMYEGSGTYSLSNGDLSVAAGQQTEAVNRANAWLAGNWEIDNALQNRGSLQALPGGPSGSGSEPVAPDPPAPGVTVEPTPDVAAVPVPGAALLGLLGFSLIGWVKRRLA